MSESLQKQTYKAALLLGSNQGDRDKMLKNAVSMIAKTIGKIKNQSTVYETSAWGNTDQPDFLNIAITLDTELKPEQVLEEILKIENKLGRTRNKRWEPRTIDIDILFYDNIIIETDDLKIPHPYLHQRMFALEPLLEIAPDWVHPVFNKNLNKLIAECEDTLKVKRR